MGKDFLAYPVQCRDIAAEKIIRLGQNLPDATRRYAHQYLQFYQ